MNLLTIANIVEHVGMSAGVVAIPATGVYMTSHGANAPDAYLWSAFIIGAPIAATSLMIAEGLRGIYALRHPESRGIPATGRMGAGAARPLECIVGSSPAIREPNSLQSILAQPALAYF